MIKAPSKAWYRWVILIACILVYSTSHLVRWNYSSITKYLITDFNIGKPELGVLGAAFFYSYGIVQVPWGVFADKFGTRKSIPFATCVLGFFLAGFAFSGSYSQAIWWRMAMGIVSATGYVSINSVISKWFTIRQRGLAMSLFSGVGGGAGEALSFLLLPIIALVMTKGIFGLAGWRGSTFVMGIVILGIGITSYFLLRSDPTDLGLPSVQKAEDREPDKAYGDTVKSTVKDPVLWLLSAVLSCYIIGCRLVPAWLPLYATDFYMQEKGMSKELAIVAGGAMATLYVLGRCVGSPLVGQFSDMLLKRYRTPRSLIFMIMMLVMSVLFYLFTLPIPNPVLLALLAFMSGTVNNSFPILNAATAELLSVKAAGFSTAVINTVGQFAGAFSLTASGFLAVRYSVKDGPFYTEFLGIWYMGILAGIIGAIAAACIIRKEKLILMNRKLAETSS